MQTTDRDAINRANARNSTGPRTEEGKKRSSLNAMRHGLTGQTVVMPTEDMGAYVAYCKKAFDELKPIGFLEEQAVQTIADSHWRLNRGRAYESTMFERLATEKEAEQADNALKVTKSLSNLSTYEHRLNRTLEQAKKELAELQKIRLEKIAAELQMAMNLRRYHLHNKIEWQPSDHSIVLPLAEIDAQIRRNTGREKADLYVLYNPLNRVG